MAGATLLARRRASGPLGASQFALFTPSGPTNNTEYTDAVAAAGRSPRYILVFKNFTQAYSSTDLDAIAARGATPYISMEPWDTTAPTWANYQLADIIAGTYDTFLTGWANGLKAWGRPVIFRFAHEMNGNWYPWAESVNGNTAGQYVTAWRHVRDLFTAVGTPNVKWYWCPNTVFSGSTALSGLYPGDSYTDIVGVDSYNWGGINGNPWVSPMQLLENSLNQVKAIAPTKPMWIGEAGSSENGGDKARWVTDLFTYLRARGDVQVVTWFDYNKETDWRINSTPAAATAFKAGLNTPPPAAITFTDTFTGANGSPPDPALWSTSGSPGNSVTIQTNRLQITSGAAGGYSDQTTASAKAGLHRTAHAVFDVIPPSGESYLGLYLRAYGFNGDLEDTAYKFQVAFDGRVTLFKKLNWVQTALAPTGGVLISGWAAGVTAHCDYTISGSTLTAYVWVTGSKPATPTIQVTDTSITTVGYAGFVLNNGAAAVSNSWQVDNFTLDGALV